MKRMVALCLPLLLAACGGAAVKPMEICNSEVAVAPPQLLYPKDGASGVPDGNFTIVVAYSNEISASWSSPALTSNGLPNVAAGAFGPAPNPLPSPAATPSSIYTSLFGSAVPALQSKTTYSIVVNTPNAGVCSQASTLGTFTTQ